MKNYLLLIPCMFLQFLAAQHTHTHDRKIVFPNIPGYLTLKCDFHQHTVFSDGSVWPNIRIQEAVRDSLDAVSMTEHLEYQPHKEDIPHPDRNRSYHVAKEAATDTDLIVVPGSEITRSMPPGHANAIFIQDANKLLIEDSVEVFREANRQGAFVFWNHPNWTAQFKDGIARLTDVHRKLIDEKLLHGIEVINDLTYSDEALQLALDHNLTIMGTSDIHGLVDWQYDIPGGGHRPITLVFAKERSAESIKDALMNRRTVAWFHDLLVGREEYLLPLLQASLTVEHAAYQGESSVLRVLIKNHTHVRYSLEHLGPFTLHANSDQIIIEPDETAELLVKTKERLASTTLRFQVQNAVTAPREHPELVLAVKIQ